MNVGFLKNPVSPSNAKVSGATVKTTAVVPGDGALGANSSIDGIIGPLWRVKYSSGGTFAGTTLSIDLFVPAGLTA